MDLTAALRTHFGFLEFRPGQREACEAALAGRDVMVVMPTGSGKSLCYQLPALLRDDLTVVVSPLVALMQDQVEALAARGLGDRVALVNAQQDAGANADVLARAAGGELRLLYVAPERFAAPGFLDRMRAGVRVGLFVVDEAHCVSQWGHDFRPDYFRLADAARALDAAAIVASTATATPRVAADVVRRLGLRDPLRVATGFDRPNISFAVARPGGHEKARLVAETLRGAESLPAIVYAGTVPEPRSLPSSSRARWARRPPPTTRGSTGRVAPTSSAASWPTICRSSARPTRSGWASTSRTCGPSSTQASRRRSRPITRRRAGPGATACRRARCSSPRTGTGRSTCTSSSARRSTRICRVGSPTASPRRRTATAATRWTHSRRPVRCGATGIACGP